MEKSEESLIWEDVRQVGVTGKVLNSNRQL